MTKSLHCGCGAAEPLTRHALAEGLSALRCAACGGVLLSLDDYRAWRSRQPSGEMPALAAAAEPAPEAGHARACPSCQRLMSRQRAGTQPDFRIDRCNACQLVWLDTGEWEGLLRAGLASQLDTVLTEAWQKRLRAAELQALRDAERRNRLGDETFAELRRIQDWLALQPKRDEILGLLASRRPVL